MTLFPLLILSSLSVFVCGLTERRENNLAIRQTANGDFRCTEWMCVSAKVNGSNVEYILSGTGKERIAWIAMGFGATMANSPMVIMWPNPDGTITLSQRSASSQVMPTVDRNPPRVATLSTALSSISGDQPKFAFTIPANSDQRQNVIYAFGTSPPASSAVDATFNKHFDSGSFPLDLTKPFPSSTSSGTSPTSTSGSDSSDGSSHTSSGHSSTDDNSFTPVEQLVIAHAVFCAVGFLVFLPAGALLARYLRTFWPLWFKGHWIAQFLIAGPTIVTGVALGIRAVSKAGASHLNDDHKKWGIAIFVLYAAQCGLGAFIHFIKPKNFTGRPPQNYLHAVFGLLVVGLALYQVQSGYDIEWPNTTGRGEAPRGVRIAWHIWVVLLPVLYFVGLALLPRQLKLERQKRRLDEDVNTSDVHLDNYRDNVD